jgi:hypothetical protein
MLGIKDALSAFVHHIIIATVKRLIGRRNQGIWSGNYQSWSDIVNAYGSVIVLEDDILCSIYFLSFMNGTLTK